MAKQVRWESTIDGQIYVFVYERIKGKHTITVNGDTTVVNGSFMSIVLGFDEPFMFDGKPARLVLEKQPDVAYNDIYLQSGKSYIQRPTWVIVFAVLCILIPVFSKGGAIPAVLGFCGAWLCCKVSKMTLSVTSRAVLCVLITIGAWALLFFLIVVLTGIYA